MAQLDLYKIQTAIKTILDTANSALADVDLSKNMSKRIEIIRVVDPSRIPQQSTLFPLIAIYTESKDIDFATIGKNQATGKRKAEVTINILGVVWNSTYADLNRDPAEVDCEYLMENIEEILRSNDKLSNYCSYSYPDNVDYFSTVIDEQTHLRAGKMSYKVIIYY